MHYERRNYSGNVFQSRRGNDLPRRYSTEEVSAGQARVLQARYARFKQPSAELSSDSGVLERTARNHLSGANCMDLTTFFNACQRIPELKSWGLKMMGADAALDPMFEAEMQTLIRTYYAIKDREGLAND